MPHRKHLLLVVSLLLLATIVAACGGQQAQPTPETVEKVVTEVVEKEVTTVVEKEVETVVTATPEPAGPVTISFWHGYNPVETELLNEEIIPAFEDEHPNIRVETQAVPYDEFRRKLLTAMAGGTAPDLIRSDIIWVPEFADMGALAPLDEVMDDYDEYADVVYEGPLSTNFWNGNYYGLPLDTNTRALMWNQAMYEATGLEAAPQTIEDFVAACEQLKAQDPESYCFADGGTYGWAVLPWIWSHGGSLTDEEMTTAEGYVNSEETVAAYELLREMVANEYMHPGILGGGVDTAGGYADDTIANLLEGPWMPAIFEEQFPDKEISWALMPAGDAGSISVVGGQNIVMFQQSQHKEAAAEFIRFMLSQETQLKMAEVGQVPVRTDVREQAIEAQPFFEIFFEQLETAQARLPHPNWPQIEELLTNAGQQILRGDVETQVALDELAPQIDELLTTP